MPRRNSSLPLGKRPTKTRQKFDRILETANDIAKENPRALIDLVRLAGRRVQATYMSELLLIPIRVLAYYSEMWKVRH